MDKIWRIIGCRRSKVLDSCLVIPQSDHPNKPQNISAYNPLYKREESEHVLGACDRPRPFEGIKSIQDRLETTDNCENVLEKRQRPRQAQNMTAYNPL